MQIIVVDDILPYCGPAGHGDVLFGRSYDKSQVDSHLQLASLHPVCASVCVSVFDCFFLFKLNK